MHSLEPTHGAIYHFLLILPSEYINAFHKSVSDGLMHFKNISYLYNINSVQMAMMGEERTKSIPRYHSVGNQSCSTYYGNNYMG